jgi:uncharacterized protein (DUF934 family)
MPKLIKNDSVVDDSWVRVEADTEVTELPNGDLLLPLKTWNEVGAQLAGDGHNVGLWLASDQLTEDIQGDIKSIPVIAVDFPMFTDGRGFSIGRLLRERYGFANELRAIGAPIRDQLSYLKRCGFDAFQLADHYDAEAALESLRDFSEFYQTAFDQREPKFRRHP